MDYDGLSNNALVHRASNLDPAEDEPPTDYGDEYIASYTYGPMGQIMRTEEMRDADPANNRHHFYLSDRMGNHVGMQLDLDGTGDDPEGTPRQARFQVHDAFGNPISDSLTRAGNYAWRGAEGSQTTAGLVEMQARTYDPAIGRFLQA